MKKFLILFILPLLLIPSNRVFALEDTALYGIQESKSYYNINDKVPPFGANDRFFEQSEQVVGTALLTRAVIPHFSYNGYDISFTDLSSQDTTDLSSCGDNGCNASYSIRLGFQFGCNNNFCDYQSTDIPINDNSYDSIPNLDFANYLINHIELIYRDLNGRVHSSPLNLDTSKTYHWAITQYGFSLWFDETPYSYAIFNGVIADRNFAEFVAIRVNYDMSLIDYVSNTSAVNTLQIDFYNNLSVNYTDQDIGVTPPIPPVDETPDIGNLINDDSVDNSKANRTLSDINSNIATNNVISDLLLLPINLYQKVINIASSSTCQRFYLGNLYGTDLYLPCFKLNDYFGDGIVTSIDIFISAYFFLVIRKKFVDVFNNMTSLKDRGNEIE